MDLITILVNVVGNGMAKGIINIWLGEENFEKEIAKNFVGILSSKTTDLLAQRKGNRQFEEISEKIAENLLPIFNSFGNTISKKRKKVIAELAGKAINSLTLSPELLASQNLDPKEIEKILLKKAEFPNEESPLIFFNENELNLYRKVISEASQYMVDIASNLPKFTETTFAEVLKRQSQILERASAILEEVKLMRQKSETLEERNREFDNNYRRSVVRNLDELELFGVDLSKTSKRYRLSVAYVSLSVEYANNNEPEDPENTDLVSIEDAISANGRILLRGPAGSGKTTLLKWIAVKTASHDFPKNLKDWNNCVPFFIRLREFSDKNLPKPYEFVELISPAIAGDMPENWVNDILRSEKGVILVDGVDELSENQRDRIKKWLEDIDGAFPNNRWIVTSRQYAADRDWLFELGFSNAELQSMNSNDVELFIEHWHGAVKESQASQINKDELKELEVKFVESH